MSNNIDNLNFEKLEKILEKTGTKAVKNACKKEIIRFQDSRNCLLCEHELDFENFLSRNTQSGFFARITEKKITVKEALSIWLNEQLGIMCCLCISLLHEIKTHQKLIKKYGEKEDLHKFYHASFYYSGLPSISKDRPFLLKMKDNLKKLQMTEYIPYIEYLLKTPKI